MADLHLSLGVPQKTMEVFGEPWIGYHKKIREQWKARVTPKDIVLIAGDISWAKDLLEAERDFAFVDALPGTKYMIRGNHDYWSSASTKKIRMALPPSLNYLTSGYAQLSPELAVVGVRLWDSPTIHIAYTCQAFSTQVQSKPYTEHDEKIFLREFGRLKKALDSLPKEVTQVIVMTHYPPISSDGSPGPVSELLEADGRVSLCIFGHLHKIHQSMRVFGKIRGIDYVLVAADYVNFIPQEIL
ncbi:putative phosphoesterase [Candidatus Chlamydia sanziniae]|uniref:Phosphoesterase n=1 Tax=Candidatus Chlamydia sanziniae TaxID=1806891 RepID=A0A1A9HU83_9CHLA|nr:putative phosphoesterase [Candidatus Chlamydia sanziniae]